MEQVQYSTTAPPAAAAYPEMNKYDPRASDKYAPHDSLPSKPNTASKSGKLGTTPRGYNDGDTGMAGREFDQQGQGYDAYDTRASEQDMAGYGAGRTNYWATAAAH